MKRSGSANQETVDVHPLATGASELIRDYPKAGRSVAFAPTQDWLATCDGDRGLHLWNVEEAGAQKTLPGKFGQGDNLAVSREELIVNVGQVDRQGVVTIWQTNKKQPRQLTLPGKAVRCRTLSPDGEYVAEASDAGTNVYRLDLHQAQLQSVAQLPGPGKPWCLALSPAAKFAAAGFWDGTVRVYRLTQNVKSTEFESEIEWESRLQHTVTKVAISSSGTQLAVFTRLDGLLSIDLITGRVQTVWSAGAAGASCLRFSADDQYLLVGLNDRTARMWSTADGTLRMVVDAQQVPRDISWSTEHSLLATIGGNMKVWQCELAPVASNSSPRTE